MEVGCREDELWSYRSVAIHQAYPKCSPLAESHVLAGYAWDAQKGRQVTYITADGHIHELAVGVDGHRQ